MPNKKSAGEPARLQNRNKPMVNITLTPEAIEAADKLAKMKGLTRSTVIEELIRDEARRERIPLR